MEKQDVIAQTQSALFERLCRAHEKIQLLETSSPIPISRRIRAGDVLSADGGGKKEFKEFDKDFGCY